MRPAPDSRPRLAPGCRLSDAPGQITMLMMPEKALRLLGPSLQIVERCDGQHTVAQIVSELQKLYAQAKPERVEQDIFAYLQVLHEKRALDFE